MRYLRLDVPVSDPRFGRLVPCEACGVVARRRLARFDAFSSLRGRALEQKFSNFDLTGEAAAAVEAFNAAVRFAKDPSGWLVIYGPVGNGKSHLAAAIANYLRHERSIAVLFLTVPSLLESLRTAIRTSNGHDEYGPLLISALDAPVLILDDFGAQRVTDWAEEVLFLILDHRYRLETPTVVITNPPLKEAPARLRSRLMDRRLSVVVCNPAPDYRRRNGKVTL